MNTIKALQLYKKDLEKIIDREEIKIQKEIDKQDLKLKAVFEDYPSEDDVMTAFGYGWITEHKKDQLLELFANKDAIKRGASVGGVYIGILKFNLSNINLELKCPDPEQEPLNENLRIEELEKENKRLRNELKNKSEKHNERGAGRKSRFSERDITMIKMYRIQNKTIKELAEMYDCSTGLIHKIINE
ncbi:hypothetical protein LGL08_20265 [Clostridium estertheticum]|uniref:hypothetical protein n=1 Tax=Clostridium estertheticum TaxID=238834 RepID=UPI001CF5E7D8|nr:hypothetical protein [Clostridium estertheticum]MCB2309041.1 hypothetical protein [Clostridium estertheticum]MCB2346825.1 hypothetical protein [Clostridium estertheticum]MCB2351863.1 hypothetical protein [Clostridium estertheticum]WAG48391.1 hypothetical protein LL127_23070 [Clostridium estertheticum]